MNTMKKLKRGFTLVELMIVVAIVGVLAVLAVYGVRKYIANAKTAEAKNSLGQMAKDAITAFEGEQMSGAVLTEGSQASVIRRICATGTQAAIPSGGPPQGAKYQSKKDEWSNATDVASNKGFPCVKFEMTAPQYYQYTYNGSGDAAEGSTFLTMANGDLNSNSQASTFKLTGKIENGRLKQAPSIEETSPEE